MIRRPFTLLALSLGLSLAGGALAGGDGTFQAPSSIINAGRPGPATVHAGDLNNDGKLDLVTANGSQSVLVFFQSPQSRLEWRQVPIRVGSLVWFVRAADFDGDGFDDIVAGDTSATAYFIRSRGDGSFDRPAAIDGSTGARWTAIGDWDNDGDLDLATANISSANLTVFLGDGTGKFALTQTLPGSREHTLEAMDYDGDGKMDLVLGTGLNGLTPHRGNGDGTFTPQAPFSYLNCSEYLAEVGYYQKGKYVLTGDFNGDGKGDLAPTCIETTSATVGISLGNGSFQKTLEVEAGPDVDSSAILDLNGDGKADLVLASKGSTSLLVYLGNGDGTFLPDPVVFGPTGDTPGFLIGRDLDGDGFPDVVSADEGSATLTIFWGKSGARFLESGFSLTGFSSAKAMAAADLDGDGVADLFLPRSDQPEVEVFLKPGLGFPTAPSLVIRTQGKYGLLLAADLDGDGIPDLAGADPAGGVALVALLDRGGNARGELSMAAGLFPSAIEVGNLDEGPTLDLAVPCKGSNHLALFFGLGGGAFSEARIVPTLEKPKAAALARFDAGAPAGIAVISDTAVAVHFQDGGGHFTAPVTVVQDPTRLYTDLAAADLDGDSWVDLAVAESKTLSVLVFKGKPGRQFDPPVAVRTNGVPVGVVLADLNGDGLLDITTSNSNSRSVSVFLNQGPQGFPGHLDYGLGLAPLGHLLADLNGDGSLDLAAFSSSSAMLLFARPSGPRFIRGDSSGDRAVQVNDPILILSRLFLGGDPLPCEKAADADDDGLIQLNDPIVILSRLFLGGAPLPPPGPEVCGEDPSPDTLGCQAGCRE